MKIFLIIKNFTEKLKKQKLYNISLIIALLEIIASLSSNYYDNIIIIVIKFFLN